MPFDLGVIYIASKTKHAPKWRKIREHGVRINSTWIDEAEPGQSLDLAKLAVNCIHEIQNADTVVLYCESEEVLKGSLIEFGAALAFGKKVVIIGSAVNLESAFSYHLLVQRNVMFSYDFSDPNFWK